MTTTTKAQALRTQMVEMIMAQSDEINIAAWTLAAKQLDAAVGTDEWAAILQVMDAIEIVMGSRGMGADEFEALAAAVHAG